MVVAFIEAEGVMLAGLVRLAGMMAVAVGPSGGLVVLKVGRV